MRLSLELGPGVEADDLFAWGDRIVEIEPRVESLVQWEEIESHVIVPELGKVLRALDGALKGELAERFRDFRGRYLRDLEGLFLAMRQLAADRSAGRLSVIERALAPHLEPGLRSEPLSRQALRHAPQRTRRHQRASSVRASRATSRMRSPRSRLPKPKDPLGALGRRCAEN